MKKVLIAAAMIAAVVAAWLVVTGFSVRTDVFITDGFTVSEDGSEMTFRVGVGSSMGFVRGYKDEGGSGEHRLKFYSAWGGLNSALGAKNEYVLELEPEDSEIYEYHGAEGYRLVLQKDAATGEWRDVR